MRRYIEVAWILSTGIIQIDIIVCIICTSVHCLGLSNKLLLESGDEGDVDPECFVIIILVARGSGL